MPKLFPSESRADVRRRLKYGPPIGSLLDGDKVAHTITRKSHLTFEKGEVVAERYEYFVHTNRRMQYKFPTAKSLQTWARTVGLTVVVF